MLLAQLGHDQQHGGEPERKMAQLANNRTFRVSSTEEPVGRIIMIALENTTGTYRGREYGPCELHTPYIWREHMMVV